MTIGLSFSPLTIWPFRLSAFVPLAASIRASLSPRRKIASSVIVGHASGLTFGSFWRQQFYYGRGAFAFHKIRAQRKQNGITLERPSFYLNLLQILQKPRSIEWLLEKILE